jgi:hypothetical protein
MLNQKFPSSDISQIFEVGDIFSLPSDTCTSSRPNIKSRYMKSWATEDQLEILQVLWVIRNLGDRADLYSGGALNG